MTAPENDQPLHASDSPLVGVVMGSDSDWRVMSDASQVLTDFGIPHEVEVVSAHRTPDKLIRYGREARGRGIRSARIPQFSAAAPKDTENCSHQSSTVGKPARSRSAGMS